MVGRSQALVTQLREIEDLGAIAVENSDVRLSFAKELRTSYLIPKYLGSEVNIASSQTVIHLKDNTVHELWRSFVQYTLTHHMSEWKDLDVVPFKGQLTLHFRYDENAFVLLYPSLHVGQGSRHFIFAGETLMHRVEQQRLCKSLPSRL